jgi:uncharacterized protein YkwD
VGRFGTRGWAIGALVIAAVVVVSLSAFVFQGRDGGDDRASSTTTTAPPAPAPTAAPTPVSVVPPPAGPAPACDGAPSAVLDAVNGDRAASGLGALCSSSALAGYARSWADWMAEHQSLTHQDAATVLAGTSFSTVAENILDGPGTMSVTEMEAEWTGSPAQRANVLGAYTAAGVGTAVSADGRIWVAVEFGA